jgi:hypothetical protein
MRGTSERRCACMRRRCLHVPAARLHTGVFDIVFSDSVRGPPLSAAAGV